MNGKQDHKVDSHYLQIIEERSETFLKSDYIR
jgi:hypothetical protein